MQSLKMQRFGDFLRKILALVRQVITTGDRGAGDFVIRLIVENLMAFVLTFPIIKQSSIRHGLGIGPFR